jgi:succinyl-CoA synthetase alpha subunit
MNSASRYYANRYQDSVALMKLSAQVMAMPGVELAAVVMASAGNIDTLAAAGLGRFEVRPNDIIVVVKGSEAGCAAALERADALLTAPAESAPQEEGSVPLPITSLHGAVRRDPGHNLALVSVPGDYAAAEAMKALRLDMDVMLFSDNVPPAAELTLKHYARRHDLLVMGPDCGTAIINGIPLGFANVVRRGPIGAVGASGTGLQEVTSRIHRLGSGISQAIGTGGHDLSAEIGGISMLQGLQALTDDPATRVIVLVSKPPAPAVAEVVLAAAEACSKPVVVIFLGVDPRSLTRQGVHGASTLAEAADLAVTLAQGEMPAAAPPSIPVELLHRFGALCRSMAPTQRHLRALFCGGTFCFEAQLLHAAAGIAVASNVSTAGNPLLAQAEIGPGHSMVDLGDDLFTRGRPHPMIDPVLRDSRLLQEADDPTTALILFDVVLGHGAAADPLTGLLGAIEQARSRALAAGRRLLFIAHVCGTDQDPQNRSAVVAALRAAEVFVADSSAEAALWSVAVLRDCLGGAA